MEAFDIKKIVSSIDYKKIFSVITVAVLSCMLLLTGCEDKESTVEKKNVLVQNPYGLECLSERPDGAALALSDIPDKSSPAVCTAYAYQLYSLGTKSCKDAEHLTVYGVCPTSFTVGSCENFVDLSIVVKKTQTQYSRTDYRLENDMPIFYMIKGSKKLLNDNLDMVITERQYTDNTMSHLTYQKVNKSATDENGVPYADWSNPEEIETEEREKPVYSSAQEGIFELLQHTVNENTIASASITYDRDGGFYRVNMALDCEKPETTERTLPLIKKGASDKNAKYTKITLDFELWNNGTFRSMHVYEEWEAKAVGFFPFASTFDYDWRFSYAESDCVITKF